MELARERLRDAIELSQESGDELVRAAALTTLSAATPYETQRDEVHALLRQSVAICRRIGWMWGLAFSQMQLGTVLVRDGEFAEAVKMHRESLEIVRDLGDDSMTVLLLDHLGADYLHMRDQESAREVLMESASLCRRADSPEGLAYCLEASAGVAYRDGNLELAARLLGAGLGIRDLITVPVWPLLEPVRDQLSASVIAKLGDAAFETEHSTGRRMKPDDALSLALEATTASSASRH